MQIGIFRIGPGEQGVESWFDHALLMPASDREVGGWEAEARRPRFAWLEFDCCESSRAADGNDYGACVPLDGSFGDASSGGFESD